jgi:hypothetical protein
MPPLPTIRDSPLKKFVCAQCNKRFRSKSGRIRHINAVKHTQAGDSDPNHGLQKNLLSPQSEETDIFSDISSCPGSLNPDTFDSGGENNFNNGDDNIYNSGNDNIYNSGNDNIYNSSNEDSDIDSTPPLSPSRDAASKSTEYHPYLNGKAINIHPLLEMS